MFLPKTLIESILSDDLATNFDQAHHESLQNIVTILEENLNGAINDINELAKSNLKELRPEINKSENFISKIKSLQDQINLIKNDLDSQENLVKNASEIDEYKKLIDHIEVINKIIMAIKSFKQFESHLNDFKLAIDTKNYSNCNEFLTKLTKINDECEFFSKKYNSETQDEIYIVKELREDFIVHRERLWYELDIEFDDIIRIDLDENDQGPSKISISKNTTQQYLNEITLFSKFKEATNHQENNSFNSFVFFARLKQLCKKFLQICQKYILNETQDIKNFNQCHINEDRENNRIELVFDQASSSKQQLINNSKGDQVLEFKLQQLSTMIQFLYDNLFKLKVNVNHSEKQVKLINIFSDLILKDFVKLIYEQLIISIIPLKNYDFSMEANICEQVAKFENDLKKIEFINQANTNVFKVFINNVEELYVRKKCKYIMESARELMKNKDFLFETIKIEEKCISLKKVKNSISNHKKNDTFVNLFNKLVKIDEERNETKTKLDELNLLTVSPCSISKIASQLVETIYETLNESLKMTENSKNVRNISLLCLVARNLFDLYSAVVPLHHSESLRNLPILSAIVYNDFKYLAFNCLTITHQYKELFLNLKQQQAIDMIDLMEIISNFSCLDLIPKLCSTGHDILMKQIQNQQNNLIQFLSEDTNGINNIAESNNFDLFKRALQKCTCQLNNLSSIWIEILTELDYHVIFGQFLELICKDLLKSVIKLEDISSDDASYLHSAFGIVNQCVFDLMSKEKGQSFKSEQKEDEDKKTITCDLVDISNKNKMADLIAAKYIKSWQKFKYLLVLLKANLVEIVDLWSDRMGPLALHYDSEEVRHLIRALFMNTDRRADALAKIK